VEFLAVWFQEEASEDFRTNINVFREPVEPGQEERYLRFSLQGVKQVQDARVTQSPGPSIDGTPSDAFDYSIDREGLAVDVRTLTAFRDGYAYNITLTAPSADYPAAQDAFDEIISSWTWES
jgi:hypothetical protein